MPKKAGLPLQQEEYLCGPSSLQKALSVYGVKVSQERIAKLCGTTEDGTDEHDLIRGITALGFEADPWDNDYWDQSIHWLDTSLGLYGAPCLLCVRVQEAWDHWVCAYAGTGPQGHMRYAIFDPQREPTNFYDGGHNMYSRTDLLRYWRAPSSEREGEGNAYYGIAVYGRGGKQWWKQ